MAFEYWNKGDTKKAEVMPKFKTFYFFHFAHLKTDYKIRKIHFHEHFVYGIPFNLN